MNINNIFNRTAFNERITTKGKKLNKLKSFNMGITAIKTAIIPAIKERSFPCFIRIESIINKIPAKIRNISIINLGIGNRNEIIDSASVINPKIG